jgi:hypothetical protein
MKPAAFHCKSRPVFLLRAAWVLLLLKNEKFVAISEPEIHL